MVRHWGVLVGARARSSSPRELLVLLRSLDGFLLDLVELLQRFVADPERDTDIPSWDGCPLRRLGGLSGRRGAATGVSGRACVIPLGSLLCDLDAGASVVLRCAVALAVRERLELRLTDPIDQVCILV